MTASRDHRSREEIAAVELGHTTVSRPVACMLTVVFLLVIVAVPAVQIYLESRDIASARARARQNNVQYGGAALPQVFDVPSLWPKREELAGLDSFDAFLQIDRRMLREINTYEDGLKDNSFLQERLVPPAQYVVTGLLEGGNEKAYCGRDRWLFYRPGIDYLTGRGFLDPGLLEDRRQSGNEWTPPPQPDPVLAIVDFKRQLAERGIELIVMPTPVKPQIHPEKFSARFVDAALPLQNPSFARFVGLLAENGVNVFDPAAELVELKKSGGLPVYLQTDTHWTPQAMQTVAAGLADRVKQLGVLADAPAAGYDRKQVDVTNTGDIALMLRLPKGQTFYPPQQARITKVLTAAGEVWSPDPQADVLLLGDSFSNIYSLGGMNWGESAGLAEHLSAILDRPLDKIVINDHGAFATRQDLARRLLRGEDRLAGKKVVIWQFAARELLVGDWKMIELKLGVGHTTSQPAAAPAGFMIEGKVGAMAKPPVPGQVPYKNAIIAVHLTDIRTDHGRIEGDPPTGILVYMWVMRDNKLTQVADFRAGQMVKLRLQPWSAVEAKIGGENRLELDDPDIVLLDPYWGELE